MNKDKIIFLTGATGYLGTELLRQMQDQMVVVFCLVRNSRKFPSAQERLDNHLREHGIAPNDQKFIAVQGDIREVNLGIDPARYQALSLQVTDIIHSAANVGFLMSKKALEMVNYDGTKNAVAFAILCKSKNSSFHKFIHVSTAYAAGKTETLVKEELSARPAAFNNDYEESKWLAEHYVAENLEGIPYAIVRPSIIVGSSEDGKANRNNVIYDPLRVLTKSNPEKTKWLPSKRKIYLDFVPVNYVASCLLAILAEDEMQATIFHVTAGTDNRANVNDVMRLISVVFSIRLVLFPFFLYKYFIAPLKRWRNSKDDVKELRIAEAYAGYLRHSPIFVDAHTQLICNKYNIRRPIWNDVLLKVLIFAKETGYGRQNLNQN